jgi:hypothetical protein
MSMIDETSKPTDTEELIHPNPETLVSGMSKAELQAECGKRGIPVKPNATKAELQACLLNLSDGATAPEPTVQVETPLTPEERARLQSASDETILQLLASGKADPWRHQFEHELAHRARVRAEAEALKARQSEIKRFRVCNTKVFYGRDFMTTLAAGSVVSAASHDLEALKAQGFLLEEITGAPRVTYDEMGVQKTVF